AGRAAGRRGGGPGGGGGRDRGRDGWALRISGGDRVRRGRRWRRRRRRRWSDPRAQRPDDRRAGFAGGRELAASANPRARWHDSRMSRAFHYSFLVTNLDETRRFY